MNKVERIKEIIDQETNNPTLKDDLWERIEKRLDSLYKEIGWVKRKPSPYIEDDWI